MSTSVGPTRDTAEERQPKDGEAARRYYLERDSRSMSIDTVEAFRPPQSDAHHGSGPPPSPYHGPSHHTSYPRYPNMQTHRMHPPHQLQSVITTSFSAEERDAAASVSRGRVLYVPEQRFDRDGRFNEEEEREQWHTSLPPRPHGFPPKQDIAASPSQRMPQPHLVQRSYSSSGYFPRTETLKRSYYHHSQPNEKYAAGELPSDFLPPKKAKVDPSSTTQDVVVAPRTLGPEGGDRPELYSRSGTWDSEERRRPYLGGRSQSYPVPPPWVGPNYHQTQSPLSYGRVRNFPVVSPQKRGEVGGSSPQWRPSPNPSPHPSPHRWSGQSPSSAWTSTRPSVPTHHQWSHNHQPPMQKELFPSDARRQGYPQEYQIRSESRMDMMVEAAAAASNKVTPVKKSVAKAEEEQTARTMVLPSGVSVLLLALPQDRVALSETLCVVRENIEVFTATQRDVDAPAPGRKHAVVVGQVGLRCIHCRHTTRCSDRVKRAVCYPSSIKRIYRTVIDMKLDHFSQCKFVPTALKDHLNELKSVHTRSTGTTMQYFIRAAHTLGMEDGTSGVRLSQPKLTSDVEQAPSAAISTTTPSTVATGTIQRTSSVASSTGSVSTASHKSDSMMSTDSFETTGSHEVQYAATDKFYNGLVSLSMPEDKASLSPLRCFLREQVCAFSATEEDIAVRAPTTFSIAAGQVGIGCIHCVKQQAKMRSNRAVCFPFSIGRIYQSVADIQRFHLAECKMMPETVREKFMELQSASSKGSKGLATRQYWVTSARKIGLVDTPQGIRFGRDPSKPDAPKAFSLDILAQVAFSVTTANKQLVLPEDKKCIAEFLYVVMEQLQPCRFTEADRNKRRLKDVGCIGVECKHCAGQVDGRKFFWSSVSAVESNFVSVHTHMLECRMVPNSLKERLADLKKLRKEQTAALQTGSQKAFFARVWERLHNDEYHKKEAVKKTDSPQDVKIKATNMVPV